ncbi:MAG: hypothetical protein KAR42_16675 [candidate division Zixibacteria bacterium]|nr:hypothetical protein [candidate division Zixibacteria bacterium]
MKDLKKFNGRELASKHAWLMDEIEQLPPGTKISPAKKQEIKTLEDELQRRLEDNLMSDVIPVIPTMRDMFSKPKSIEKKIGPLVAFNFEVMSEMNTRIGRFKIEATTKDEAWKKARKKAMVFSGQVSLKIS